MKEINAIIDHFKENLAVHSNDYNEEQLQNAYTVKIKLKTLLQIKNESN